MLLFDLFWSANIKIPNKESDKRLIETNISIIRKYRNKLAHMNRLDNYDVYRGIDNMILLC